MRNSLKLRILTYCISEFYGQNRFGDKIELNKGRSLMSGFKKKRNYSEMLSGYEELIEDL